MRLRVSKYIMGHHRWLVVHQEQGLITGLILESPMAIQPTAEKCAREILAIFVWHFGLLAGEVLRRKSFLTLWPQRGYRAKDFKAGLQFAIESGWLELLPNGNSYRLTRIGFADG